MNLQQATQAMQGILVEQAPLKSNAAFQRVSIDSRRVQPGDLFVAIRGEHFDGHEFAAQALKEGAEAVVVSEPLAVVPRIEVQDTRKALGLLAAAWLDQFAVRRVAVTGNSGKTSVKEMLAHFLAAAGQSVLATQGNFNNDIGVPLTLLQAQAQHQVGVFELGASAAGEIAWTTRLVKPEVALITNVTGAHLAGFGSLQGIADAKAEIFEGAAAGSVAIINADDDFSEFFIRCAQQQGLQIVTTAVRNTADWQAQLLEVGVENSRFVLTSPAGSCELLLPLPGAHQVNNCLMAMAAASALGVANDVLLAAVATVPGVGGRLQVERQGQGLLVDDSYNANPGSVRAAIDWLQHQAAPRVLVLGNLGELGATAAQQMSELGAYAATHAIEHLLVQGDLADFAGRSFGQQAEHFTQQSALVTRIREFLEQGATVLVKGSRSARMDEVVAAAKLTGGTH